ncbi:beta-galactosidase [Daejeonella lutea]|nr:beta-galactosidase [Daejeonella lutea]
MKTSGWGYRNSVILFLLITLTVEAIGQSTSSENPNRNDHIFPPSKEASAFINFDRRGFIINGRKTFLVSAGIEYARVPRALWKDRLERLKRGGYNAVEIYTFWNFHEAEEGKFNFSGDHDLDAFLNLVKSLDMFAIVRVGPYYCGEWNFGGFPIWLKFKPGLVARKDNVPFLEATDRFFEKLIPIVSKNQIHKGGPVIMVQLENEHPESWGTKVPNPYFSHLIKKANELGLEVPYFFSGLHPGNDPAGNLKNLDDPKRPNPWFSTEFWGVWFFNYGPQPQDSTIYDRRTWKIIAGGGNGYNVYMAHGGSNFGYNNDRDMAASYDYGAGVGQAGDLRPIFFAYKRAAWFARSFQEVLANSTDGGKISHWMIRDTAIKVNARVSPAGTITFLDNPGKIAKKAVIQPPKGLSGALSANVKIAAGEIMPVIQNFKIAPAISLDWAPTRIYTILPQGKTSTVVVYGDLNSLVQLYFSSDSSFRVLKGNANFVNKSTKLVFSSVVKGPPAEYIFSAGVNQVRILVVQSALAAKTWIEQIGQDNYLITGPSYIKETSLKNGKIMVSAERQWNDKNPMPTRVYTEKTSFPLAASTVPSSAATLQLHPDKWQIKPAVEAALPELDDSAWTHSTNPLQMGADGDLTANAWYRSKVQVDTSGTYIMRFKNVKERATIFVNGVKQDAELTDKSFTINLNAGKVNTVSIFTAHNGRNKQLFFLGGLDTIDMKGIAGPVTLERDSSNVKIISNWKLKGGPGDPFAPDAWTSLPPGDFAGPAFFKSTFTLPRQDKSKTIIWRVNVTTMGHGSVWVNGHNLGRYPEKIKVSGLYIPESWLKEGENTLVIYDEDGTNPGKVAIEAEKEASRDNFLLAEY